MFIILVNQKDILFDLFGITFYVRGSMFTFAIILSLALILHNAHKNNKDWLKFGFIYISVVFGIFICSKILFLIINIKELSRLLFANPFTYGASSYGAIIGSTAAGYISIKLFKMDFWETSDYFIIPAILSAIIGRISCFITGCCAGTETTMPWGVVYNNMDRAVHPAQLYEVLLLIFILIYIHIKMKRSIPGELLILFLLLYALVRIILDFIKVEPIMYRTLPYMLFFCCVIQLKRLRSNWR